MNNRRSQGGEAANGSIESRCSSHIDNRHDRHNVPFLYLIVWCSAIQYSVDLVASSLPVKMKGVIMVRHTESSDEGDVALSLWILAGFSPFSR